MAKLTPPLAELKALLGLLNDNNVLTFEGFGYKLEFATADDDDPEVEVETDEFGVEWTELPVVEPN